MKYKLLPVFAFGVFIIFFLVFMWKREPQLKFKDPTIDLGDIITHKNVCRIYNIYKYVNTRLSIQCKKQAQYDPPIVLCLYRAEEDVISSFIHRGEIWERPLHQEIKSLLLKDPMLNLIDIGANIGIYSIYAGKLGRKVVSVEPVDDNLIRFGKSIVENGLQEKITLLQNAVSSKRTSVSMVQFSENNQGTFNIKETQSSDLKSIYMDDLLHVINFSRAIIKIDIEGNEHRAFSHASVLLKKIYVPVIFMEFVYMTRYGAKPGNEDYQLTINMLDMFQRLHYIPYGSRGRLDYKGWKNWEHNVKFILEPVNITHKTK